MNPFEMVVLIVAIVVFGRVMQQRYKRLPKPFPPELAEETQAMRDELRTLRDRVAVLERLATDGRDAAELDREIAKLR